MTFADVAIILVFVPMAIRVVWGRPLPRRANLVCGLTTLAGVLFLPGVPGSLHPWLFLPWAAVAGLWLADTLSARREEGDE